MVFPSCIKYISNDKLVIFLKGLENVEILDRFGERMWKIGQGWILFMMNCSGWGIGVLITELRYGERVSGHCRTGHYQSTYPVGRKPAE